MLNIHFRENLFGSKSASDIETYTRTLALKGIINGLN